MNRIDQYNLILSWDNWLKDQPRLRSVITHAKNKEWDKSIIVLKQLKRGRAVCAGKEFFRYHAIFYTIEGIDELIKHTEYVCKRYLPAAPGLYSLLGHRYYDKKDLTKMEQCYLKSLEISRKLPSFGTNVWGLSTYFYLSSYVKNEDRAEHYMCDLLEQFGTTINPRANRNRYIHKIGCPAIWLVHFGKSKRAKRVLKKIPEIPSFTKEEAINWLKRNQAQSPSKWRLPRNGDVAQGPIDLSNRRRGAVTDVTWGWLNRFKKES